MTVGADIKEAYVEVGTKIKVMRSGETPTYEYIDFEVNIRASNPFHREYFLESNFPYDSLARAGDVIEMIPTGKQYLVMTKTPSAFENEVIEYNNVLYRCNVSGELKRPVATEVEPEHFENVFQAIRTNCYGLMTECNYDNEWRTNREIADFAVREIFLYLPSNYNIQTEDRYSPVSGEDYRVGIIKRRVYENTDVAQLHEDNR